MMQVNKVDHILRAAGEVTGRAEFVLIGSAAIFAWRHVVPPEMAMTREVDLFVYDADDAESISFELEGSLGQASSFDQTYGYYCDGVGPETAILPTDWLDRSIRYESAATGGVTAIVPEPNDIALSKLCPGREKDIAWVAAAAQHGIVDLELMRARIAKLPSRPEADPAVLEQRLATVRARLDI